jgi:wyosine [tRNA(Phe)-imidazoG37] synthetase (radical SAM superfamily)
MVILEFDQVQTPGESFIRQGYLKEKLANVGAHEFCLIAGYSPDVSLPALILTIRTAVSKTDQVFLKIPSSQLNIEELNSLSTIGLKGVVVELATMGTISQSLVSYEEFAGDRLLMNQWQKLCRELPPQMETIPCIQVRSVTPYLLGPILADFGKLAQRRIFLDPSGLSIEKDALVIKEAFDYLVIRQITALEIYFTPENPHRKRWEIATNCSFSGLELVHIDISNRCTHSCVFCGLYSESSRERFKADHQGVLPQHLVRLMASELDADKGLQLIKELPLTVEAIQFGGAGDPLLHPRILELVKAVIDRGINLEILSNMEYLDDEKIGELHRLSTHGRPIIFVMNLGAATAETYVKIRPRQSINTFNKVMKHLRKMRDLKIANQGRGIDLTPMIVFQRMNMHELEDFVRLAKDLGCQRVYLKNLEIHHEDHYALLPRENEMEIYRAYVRSAIALADELGVELVVRENLVKLSERTSQNDSDFIGANLGEVQGGNSADLYSRIPCRIGYRYVRFEVDGAIRPCCIAKYPLGNTKSASFSEIWHGSSYMAFREKMQLISKQKFHLKDREWFFCQQCTHQQINRDAEAAIGTTSPDHLSLRSIKNRT